MWKKPTTSVPLSNLLPLPPASDCPSPPGENHVPTRRCNAPHPQRSVQGPARVKQRGERLAAVNGSRSATPVLGMDARQHEAGGRRTTRRHNTTCVLCLQRPTPRCTISPPSSAAL